jgi:TolA-binding protein
MAGNDQEVILAATAVLTDAKVAPELENEARYYRAQSLVKVNQMAHAVADWQSLAQDTRNAYGAEAKYRLAQYLFDAGKTAEAENEVLNYLEVSTPHAYWLARSFVLLSDIYAKLDRKLEARQYLLSLKQNYQADDDIAGMIESRLEKLNE